MTPEQEKQWRDRNEEVYRAEFELTISLQARSKNGKGKYANSLYQHRWEGYLAARKKAQEEIDELLQTVNSDLSICSSCFIVSNKGDKS